MSSAKASVSARILPNLFVLVSVSIPLCLVSALAGEKRAVEPRRESSPDRSLIEVSAIRETDPIPSDGDAADDPAIWIHPTDFSQSTIIGTDKNGGLAVYDLYGDQIQYLRDGKMVNVDVRHGFLLGGEQVDIVTSGDRSDHSIAIYTVDRGTRRLTNVAARNIRVGIRVYGSCMYRSRTDTLYMFVDSKSGDVEQWELFDDGDARVDARRVRTFDVGTTVEGCVADDELGYLYIGEENVGVWKYFAEPGAGNERVLVDRVGRGGHLTKDVEGLALYYGANGTGYLIVSSQGSDTFSVYRREHANDYVASFVVVAGNGIDEVTHADGIDVAHFNLGPNFPSGVFVTQDDQNDRANQNFKLVSWKDISDVLPREQY